SRAQALAHVGDWDWELATNTVHWSDELYRIYGFEPHEIAPDYDLILQQMHPASREDFLQAIDAALKGEKPFEMDYIFFRKDGEEAILHTIGQVLRDKSGAPVGMAGVVQDITEQKRIEKLLRLSEDKCRTIFDKATDGILIADAENRTFVEANRTICEMLGYGKDQLLRMGIADIHPEADFPAVQEAFGRQLRGENSLAENIPIKRKDGSLFYADINSTMMDIGGKPCLVGIFRDITERRRTEEALKAERKRLAESQRIAHIGSWEHNLKTNQAFWSDEMFRLLGLDPKEDENFDLFFSMVHPDDRPLLKKSIEEALRGNKPFRMDYRCTTKEGTIKTIRALAELIPDDSGELVILSGTAQDITEQKRIETLLRLSEDKFRTIFDKANDGILIADAERMTFIEANRIICEMLDHDKDELLQLGIADIHQKGDIPAALDSFERLRRGEISLAENIPVKRRDGTLFYADISAAVMEMEGKPCMVGIFRDITERRQAEEELRQNESFVRNILDSVDEGFILVDRSYRILTANRAYCKQVGLSFDQVEGRPCFEVSHKLSRPCHQEGEECCVSAVFATGLPQTTHHRHEDSGGNSVFVEIKAFPLKDASGKVIRAIETVSDVTEKRLLEEERLKVQKLEAIGTLAGGIAHDFNNLLQGVFGYLSLAKAAVHDNKQESMAALEEAEKALHLSVKLTNQLLTFSKGGKPVKKPIDLQPAIDNAVRFALSGSRADCRTIGAEDLWQVEADEGQVTQMLQNIILNAAQAMPDGGQVKITTRNLQSTGHEPVDGVEKGRYVEVAIRDEGMGIDKKTLPRIFDPYFTTKEKGSGLGLATSYSIIRNHGGRITVDSRPGKGTTFFIYLPISETERKTDKPATVARESSRAGRFLVMDDEPMVCRVATSLIKKLGHQVQCAATGEEAVAMFKAAMDSENPFDAVILDLTVRGGMGGAKAVRELAAIDPAVKAVVSSGYADNDAMANYRDYGFTAFLNKPYDMNELQDVLLSLLIEE
ncbi:MAG: PAS domain S-box protein, partial [Deltaproteobacteria bacterium]